MTLIEELQGPIGGVIALSFGMGAASGYAFALKTALAQYRERMAEMKAEKNRLHEELTAARADYLQELKSRRDG